MSRIRLLINIIVVFVASFALGATVYAARFELSPSNGTFVAGCNSAISIMLSTQDAQSDAANIIIHYNPSEIEIIDANPTLPGVQITPGTTYDIYADNTVLTGEGTIRLTGFSIGHSYNSGSGFGVFGSIPFKSRTGVESTSLTIDYVPGSTTDSNVAEFITSNDLLTGVTDGSYTFVVGPCIMDTTPPYVTDADPAPGTIGAPLDSNITFHLRDNQSGVDITSVVVIVQGIEYTYDGVNRFSYSGDPSNYSITVDPLEDFIDGVIVRVEIRAQDKDLNVMSPYRYFFNQPPEPPPVPPTCEELGCPEPEECILPEEVPACIEPEVVEVPEQTVSLEEHIDMTNVEFWASRKTVRLFPDSLGLVKVLSGTTYSIKIAEGVLAKEAESLWWYAGQSTYQLALDAEQRIYWGDFGAPTAPRAVPAHIVVNYADGSTDVIDFTAQTVSHGYIYEVIDGQEKRLADTQVTVWQHQSPAEVWNAAAYYQQNPVWTPTNGQFGFYVPQGY